MIFNAQVYNLMVSDPLFVCGSVLMFRDVLIFGNQLIIKPDGCIACLEEVTLMKRFFLFLCCIFMPLLYVLSTVMAMPSDADEVVCIKSRFLSRKYLAVVKLPGQGACVCLTDKIFKWKLLHEGYGVFKLQACDSHMKDYVLESSTVDSNVYVSPDFDVVRQLWTFQVCGEGYYRIVQRVLQSAPSKEDVKYLTFDIYNGQIYMAPLIDYESPSCDNQLWIIE